MSIDILSDELSRARAEGAVFSVLHRVAPWGLGFGGTRPLTAHILLEGAACVQPGEGDPIELRARDVLLATAGSPYSVVSEPGAAVVSIGEARAAADGPAGAASATVLCGAYTLSGSVGESLLRSLPPFAVIRSDDQEPAQRIAIDLLAAEAVSGGEGQQALLDRLLDVTLVYTLRAWWRLSDTAPGWYRALRNPHLRRVLEDLHADPGRGWSVEAMAKRAGLSRAAFAAQFHAIVGAPPARFLTELRMTRAEDALMRTDRTLATIASEVGYGNEYAFATAFRRLRGTSPGRWRRDHRPTRAAAAAESTG